MNECLHTLDDGAYVLGALSPEDRVAFERHLTSCPECARSVRELAGLPGLLSRVPVEVLDPEELPQPVPDTLLPALVRRVHRAERRRTWLTAGLVAAAATVAIGAVGIATMGGDDGDPRATPTQTASPTAAPSTAPPELMQAAAGAPISGWLSLTEVGWGTRLDLTCSYGQATDGYAGPPTYRMYVRTADGEEQVASWKALPGETLTLVGATAADAEDITSVEVRTTSGETVLKLG